MCWVTLDRAAAVFERHQRPGRGALEAVRDHIRDDVLTRGWNADVGAFTATYDSDELDAAVLFVGLSGLLPGTDERFVSTVKAVETHLRKGPVVMRYLHDDGLPGREGGFLVCALWLAEAYLLCGRDVDATDLFDQVRGLAGPTGLFTEQYEPRLGVALGNFAQTYSHHARSSTWRCASMPGVPRRTAAPRPWSRLRTAGVAKDRCVVRYRSRLAFGRPRSGRSAKGRHRWREPARRAPSARDGFLDAVRAIAVIRVVTWHTYGWAPITWVRSPRCRPCSSSAGTCSLVRSRGDRTVVAADRLRRLLIPYWLFGLVAWFVMVGAHTLEHTPETEAAVGDLVWWVMPFNDPHGSVWEAGWLAQPLWYVRCLLWLWCCRRCCTGRPVGRPGCSSGPGGRHARARGRLSPRHLARRYRSEPPVADR